MREQLYAEPSSADAEPYELTDEALRAELDTAREKWATLSSMRHRRAGDYKGVRKIHGFNAAKERYTTLFEEFQRREQAEELAGIDDITQQHLRTAEFWLQGQNDLRQEAKDTVEGTNRWQFLNKFSEFMNRGNVATRTAKSVALGFAAVGVVTVAAGGIAATAAVTSGVIAVSRFGRGYITQHSGGIEQLDMSSEEILSSIDIGENATHEEFIAALQARMNEIYEADSKGEQKKIRKAVKVGAATVAAGAIIGEMLGAGGASPANAADNLPIDSSNLPLADSATGVDGNYSMYSDGGNYGNYQLVSDVAGNHDINTTSAGDTSSNYSMAERGDMHDRTLWTNHDMVSGDESNTNLDIVEFDPDATGGWTNLPLVDTDVTPDAGREIDGTSLTNHGLVNEGDAGTNLDIVDTDSEDPGDTKNSDGWTNLPLVDTETSHETGTDSFTVGKGDGYTHVLIDQAAAQGVEMNPEQAWESHQALVDAYGPDYINLIDHHGADTYSMGESTYEVGISAPTEATWDPNAAPMVADAIDDGVINGSVDADMFDASDAADSGEAPDVADTAEPETDVAPTEDSSSTTESGASDDGSSAEATENHGMADDTEVGPVETDTLTNTDWKKIDAALDTAVVNDQLSEISQAMQADMNKLGPKLAGIEFSDGSPIVEQSIFGNWLFVNPTGDDTELPRQADKIIRAYLDNHDTARERVLDFVS